MKLYVAKYGPFKHTAMIFPEAWHGIASIDDDMPWTLLPCTQFQAWAAFKKAGRKGGSPLGFIWLPPFLFQESEHAANDEHGLCIWYAPPDKGNTAYLLSDRRLKFVKDWKPVTLKETPTNS